MNFRDKPKAGQAFVRLRVKHHNGSVGIEGPVTDQIAQDAELLLALGKYTIPAALVALLPPGWNSEDLYHAASQ